MLQPINRRPIKVILSIAVAMPFFLTLPMVSAQEEESKVGTDDKIPEGMKVQKVGDLRLLVPEDSKMRKVGDLLVVESPTEYYSRTMLEVKEDVDNLWKHQEDLRNEINELKKRVDDMQKKSLVSGAK